MIKFTYETQRIEGSKLTLKEKQKLEYNLATKPFGGEVNTEK